MSSRRQVAAAPRSAPFEDRRRARDEKREAVLRMAARMFLDQGYHRTALGEVAAQLNITKPALYNYFRSKEEILVTCFRLGQDLYDTSIAAITHHNGDGLHKLRELVRAYVRVITTDFGMCVTRLDDRELGDVARTEIRRGKRRYNMAFRTQIACGIRDGSIMPCDTKLAAFALTGALNGIGDWYKRDGAFSVETIAEEFSLRLTDGLAVARNR
jgi:AcrR family transcriptional regulator